MALAGRLAVNHLAAPVAWIRLARLVSALPRFKAAATPQEWNREIVSLVDDAGLGSVSREWSGRVPREAAALGDAFRWIDDSQSFEPETTVLLKATRCSTPRSSSCDEPRRLGARPQASDERPHPGERDPSDLVGDPEALSNRAERRVRAKGVSEWLLFWPW